MSTNYQICENTRDRAADSSQVKILKRRFGSSAAWAFWREQHVQEDPRLFGLELRRRTFYHLDLQKADLRSARLSRVSFKECNFRNADLSEARITGDPAAWKYHGFIDCDLQGACFRKVHCVNVAFLGNAQEACFRDSTLDRITFSEANVQGADFKRATFFETFFSKAILRGANFEGARLNGSFSHAQLQDANLQRSFNFRVGRILKGKTALPVTFTHADLEGADFAGARLVGHEVDFSEATLTGVNFVGAILRSATFKGADLQGANFQRADIRNVNFERANMLGTNLKDAKISNANFKKAKVDESDLSLERLGII